MNNWDLYRYAHRGSGTTDTRFKSLVERTITDVSDDSDITMGDYAFCNCIKLTNVDLPNLTYLGRMRTFAGCKGLTEINFPNVTGQIGIGVFEDCTNLREVNLPKVTALDNGAFQNCANLRIVHIPNVKGMRFSAFENCVNLTTIDLPSLTSTTGTIFKNCTSLIAVVLRAPVVATLSASNEFTNTPIANGTGYIYAPDELVDSYKTATNWVTYAEQIKPLSEYGGD